MGGIIALWALIGMVIMPLVGQIKFLFTSRQLAKRRTRALLSVASISVLLVLSLFVVPAPHATFVEGVVLPPDGSEIRAGAQGEVVELLAQPDTHVSAGQPLLVMEDPYLETELKRLAAQQRELMAEYDVLVSSHEMVRADILRQELSLVEKEISRKRTLAANLTLHSPVAGLLLVQQPGDLPGLFLHQGDLVGYVFDNHQAEVSVAVSQEAIGLVRRSAETVQARYANRPGELLPVKVVAEIPESRQRLPSPALGSQGGGGFTLHPDDNDGTRPLETVFELRLQLEKPVIRLGERVIVCFQHSPLPLGWQWYRSIRQLFLKRLNL
ncbi:MAG: hypothetical protein B6D79_11150 [gamma proteobacterium symbiont of Ctena orbiculata]|nr:MAG: hypothetical protein B6D79_11150 [gamma proteobacterium symbiont of Ctena orbiculata]